MSTNAFQIPMVGYTKNEYILHNASPEKLELRWASRAFTLPPVDQVGPSPAHYDDGTPIPGTLVLEDGYTYDKDGGIPSADSAPNWSAFSAIRNVLGVDPVTKQAVGFGARAGLSFLPNRPTRELVAQIRVDGERRWQEHMVEWADFVVHGYQTACDRARQAGAAPPPPSSDYMKACAILEKRKKDNEALWSKAPVPVEATDDEELEFLAFAEAEAMAMAKKVAVGKEVDETELANTLLQKPEVRAALQRKFNYRIRKKGHMDVPVPEER